MTYDLVIVVGVFALLGGVIAALLAGAGGTYRREHPEECVDRLALHRQDAEQRLAALSRAYRLQVMATAQHSARRQRGGRP
jgi:hypothetical protein